MTASTTEQRRAIAAGGNVLVMAGAGTGKTRTLVERCLARLLDPVTPCSLDEVLMVTFTEAAAAEIRKRIRDRLTTEAAAPTAGAARAEWIAEQLALVDTAPIATLHAFCLQLLREHFHQLPLDPQFSVLEESRARILAAEVLHRVLEAHYAGTGEDSEAVRQLIMDYGGGRDDAIRDLVMGLHHYRQTLPDPAAWLAAREDEFAADQPPRGEEWLRTAFDQLVRRWSAPLAAEEHPILQQCGQALASGQARLETHGRLAIAEVCAIILAADRGDWLRQKTKVRPPFATLFADAAFLEPLARVGRGPDPLVEDWGWVRPPLLALLRLTRQFGAEFARAKGELAAVDFHDLEQFALRLLWDRATEVPTALARRWRQRFRHVLVDEYQDINAAQDRILSAVSREGPEANRFLVGDVKQSIYRFRLANPRIFQRYVQAWAGPGHDGQVVSLRDNFRSHEAILEFVNALFAGCLRSEVGGVDYDAGAHLRFGNAAGRPHFARGGPADPPRVELHLRRKKGSGTEDDSDDPDVPADRGDSADVSETEQEAQLVVARLARLKAEGLPVWDEGARALRPVEWRDMVVLLRAPRSRAEAFTKVFEAAGVPLVATRRGMYQAIEVSDLLNLLLVLDNPLQDLPLLAVLRSPLVGLTLDELATVRLAERPGRFWTALKRFNQPAAAVASAASAAARPKVAGFLRRYGRWRALARRGALAHCLETVLDETHYEDWWLAQPRGDQRRANIQRFLGFTRQFDNRQSRGLFRFLRLVEAQLEAEFDPEPAATEVGNAVRLMSVHQSKGLEFPVVVVAGLGQRFNQDDLRAAIILDEDCGLCPLVRPANRERMYPSLPYWIAKRRQQREALGEELRLLYVAFTRACDRLILVGTANPPRPVSQPPTPADLLEAKCDFDWLLMLAPQLTGRADWLEAQRGRSPLLDWQIHEPSSAPPGVATSDAGADRCDRVPVADEESGSQSTAEWAARFRWSYPHPAATREPAKTSVTELRRRAEEEADDVARPWFAASSTPLESDGRPDSARRGLAHHRFLELLDLERVGSLAEVVAEADRLHAAGQLGDEDRAALDLPAVASFWTGPLGQAIRENRDVVRREVQFTARFTAADLTALSLPASAGLGEDEFVIVQGVADLVVALPDALWIVDFKTDALRSGEIEEKARLYRPQLALYALALGRIFARPVTGAWLHFLAGRESVAILVPPGK